MFLEQPLSESSRILIKNALPQYLFHPPSSLPDWHQVILVCFVLSPRNGAWTSLIPPEFSRVQQTFTLNELTLVLRKWNFCAFTTDAVCPYVRRVGEQHIAHGLNTWADAHTLLTVRERELRCIKHRVLRMMMGTSQMCHYSLTSRKKSLLTVEP